MNELIDAVKQNRIAEVKQLLEKSDPNCKIDSEPLLTYAIKEKFDKIALLLLEHRDIDINVENRHGENALIVATEYGGAVIVEELLKRKDTDVNVENILKTPVLLIALGFRYEKIAKLLLERPDIDVIKTDKYGRNALLVASQIGSFEIVEMIISKGADVNYDKFYGVTALFYAVLGNHIDIVKLLLQQGANIDSEFVKTYRVENEIFNGTDEFLEMRKLIVNAFRAKWLQKINYAKKENLDKVMDEIESTLPIIPLIESAFDVCKAHFQVSMLHSTIHHKIYDGDMYGLRHGEDTMYELLMNDIQKLEGWKPEYNEYMCGGTRQWA